MQLLSLHHLSSVNYCVNNVLLELKHNSIFGISSSTSVFYNIILVHVLVLTTVWDKIKFTFRLVKMIVM